MSRLTEIDLNTAVYELLTSFNPTGKVERLSGGNINHVWRVHGSRNSLIAKHAPPFIASNPDVPLDSQRIEFEATAMKLLAKDGTLSDVVNDDCRPPKLLVFDSDRSLLLMEDVGDYTELDDLDFSAFDPMTIGERLGSFIGSLHKMTSGNSDLKKSFHNAEIQRVRYQMQYESAHEYAGVDDKKLRDKIKEKSRSLGISLQNTETGKCLLMGDLWPPSIFVNEHGRIRLIDWEFVHYGRPLQDIGHFAAHCWMQGQIQSHKNGINLWMEVWSQFLSGYRSAAGETFQNLMDKEEFRDIGVHIGTEVLVRTYGPFREGYIYDSFDESHPLLTEASDMAIELILNPNTSKDVFLF